jgi:hypothetical protein
LIGRAFKPNGQKIAPATSQTTDLDTWNRRPKACRRTSHCKEQTVAAGLKSPSTGIIPQNRGRFPKEI